MKQVPVTIRAYGLIEFTKKQYVLTQLNVFTLGVPIIVACIYLVSIVGPAWLSSLLIVIGVVALIGEIVETTIMLILFYRKEHQSTPR